MVNPLRALDIKFKSTDKALKRWSQKKFAGSIWLQLAMAKEVVSQLERAKDDRALSPKEVILRYEHKFKCLGLTSLARSIAR
jgi:hypothetical protein